MTFGVVTLLIRRGMRAVLIAAEEPPRILLWSFLSLSRPFYFAARHKRGANKERAAGFAALRGKERPRVCL
jgi:hypothetical protein